jgi:hypothetical protein
MGGGGWLQLEYMGATEEGVSALIEIEFISWGQGLLD